MKGKISIKFANYQRFCFKINSILRKCALKILNQTARIQMNGGKPKQFLIIISALINKNSVSFSRHFGIKYRRQNV